MDSIEHGFAKAEVSWASAMMLQVLRNWAWLERSQWFSRKRLIEIQNRNLKRVLRHAYEKVPFYYRTYEAAGLSRFEEMDAIRITQLPIVTKDVFRAAPLQERTAVDVAADSCMPLVTSGTSGQAVKVLQDPYSAAYREALNLRLLWAYGVRPLDKICRVRLRVRPELAVALAERHGVWGYLRRRFSRTLLSAGDIGDHVDFCSTWKPAVLFAAGSYCRALMDMCERLGRRLSFKVVITTGEMSDRSTRNRISEEFNAEVFDHYGIEEVGSIAWECPTHTGHHINSDSLVVELLRNGEPVDGNEPGEVHVTSFHSQATPIIRYSTGDVASQSDEECPCGRGLPLFRNLEGRILDFVLTIDGRYISPMAVMLALDDSCGISSFKVTQREDFTIEVLATTNEKKVERVIQSAQQSCRQLFGKTPVSISIVDRIETPSMRKFRQVESQLTHRTST